MTTICAKCVNLHGTAKSDPWWRWLCMAQPIEPTFNYVTGKEMADPPYAYCKNVNRGECSDFLEGPNIFNPKETT